MDKEKRYTIINGKNVEYYVVKKKIKNMNMRLSDNGEIIISIPKFVSLQKAESFLVSKYSWVEKQQKKYDKFSKYKETSSFKENEFLYFMGKKYCLTVTPSKENRVHFRDDYIEIFIKERYVQNIEYVKRYYENWLKDYCYDICQQYVSKYQICMQKYNVPSNVEISIKKYKAKWGACIPKKKQVSFNMNLIKVPLGCLEYVVVHELAHFKYFNHSKMFYNLIEQFIPDWKERRKILNENYGRVLN